MEEREGGEGGREGGREEGSKILLLLSQLIPGEMDLDMDHLVLSYISLSQIFTSTPARTNHQVRLVAPSPTQISHLHNTIQTPPPVGI